MGDLVVATLHVRRLIIVIKAVRLVQANMRTRLVDAEGGERTFTNGLVPVGSLLDTPPTHYWCSWAMRITEDSDIRARLQAWVDTGDCWVFNGNTTTPEELLVQFNMERALPVGVI